MLPLNLSEKREKNCKLLGEEVVNGDFVVSHPRASSSVTQWVFLLL
jgi:hypothetical protein